MWRFYDGHVIILRGAFSCQISAFHNRHATGDQPVYMLKIETMSFDSSFVVVMPAGKPTPMRSTNTAPKSSTTAAQNSAESMTSEAHLGAILTEAREIVARALEASRA